MSPEHEFERGVLRRLEGVGRRLRWYVVVRGLAVLAAGGFLAGSLQFVLDYNLRLRVDMRAALLGAILLGLGFLAWRRIWLPFRVPFGAREMATVVERRFPHLHSVLVSAVQFARGEVGPVEANSPRLMSLVIERASREAAGIPFRGVLLHGGARRAAAAIVVLMSVVVTAVVLRPEAMGMWFDRNVLLSGAEWPRRTRLVVHLERGELLGARGDDLEIRASAEGDVPRDVDVTIEPVTGKLARESMIRVGRSDFRFTVTRAEEEFRFKLRGGDDETPWYQARLVDRPQVEESALWIEPPAYSGIEAHGLPPNQRAAETLKGSRIRIDVGLNKPVVSARLMAGQDVVQVARGGEDQWSVAFAPDETRTYHFDLIDKLGFENKRPTRFSVRVLKDDTPRVRLKVAGVSDIITPAAVLPLEMSFSDTYGLSRAEFVHAVSREQAQPVVVALAEFNPGMTQFDTRLSWPAGDAGLVPGDRLTLYARGADFDDISGPNEGQSATAVYRVLSADEFLAELARREQEYRQEFERVIEQQEGLRGELLTLIRRLDEAQIRERLSDLVAPMERRQRQIASQVNLLRQQFEQILAELEINGLDSVANRERLETGIVDPLAQLTRRNLPEATDLLRAFARSGEDASAGAADQAQEALLLEMRRILNSMLKWEGFQEAVTMLREILRLQGELNNETQEELERRAAEILGGNG